MSMKNRHIKSPSPGLLQQLPQNIVLLGEGAHEEKSLYILQSVYREIHKFTKNKNSNESGGLLIGGSLEKFNKTHIIIEGFVEAKFCESTPTTLKFTHRTWEYVHGEIGKKYPTKSIVGWIHTHPGHGIFLSEYDRFVHENFFKEHDQVAYVVDPVQHTEGFYFWSGQKIEKCSGFYLYDRPGVRIDERRTAEAQTGKPDTLISILLAGSALLTLLLLLLNLQLSSRFAELKTDVEALKRIALQYQQQMGVLQNRIDLITVPVETREPAAEEQSESAGHRDENADESGEPSDESGDENE